MYDGAVLFASYRSPLLGSRFAVSFAVIAFLAMIMTVISKDVVATTSLQVGKVVRKSLVLFFFLKLVQRLLFLLISVIQIWIQKKNC